MVYTIGIKKPLIITIGALVVAGLIVAGWLLFRKNAATETTTERQVSTEAPAGTPELVIGDPAAPITIVEYGDFQCPVCKRFFNSTEPELVANWIDTGRAKLEFRVETHIGRESVYAGEAAYCAAEGDKFRQLHNLLFSRQNGADSGAFSFEKLKGYGSEIGLGEDFASCVDERRYQAAVAASDKDADSRISSTPTFFIGDKKIVGAQSYPVFAAILEDL